MKQSEIKVGGRYLARISGKIVPVRVDAIRERLAAPYNRPRKATAYDVTNLATGRTTTFRSAAKFRGVCRAACSDSPSGEHDFEPDIEYDPTGLSIRCTHCGELPPPAEEDKRTAEARLLRENLEKESESREPLV